MKNFYLLSIILTSLFLGSCQPFAPQKNTADVIPSLLMRSKVIGPEAEMGFMLDQYNKLVAKIKTNPADQESRLSLAELFMMEARISGEHGYYYPSALTVIEGVMGHELKDPIRYRALIDKSSVLLSLHQFKAAKETGEQALVLNSHSAEIYGVLVDANVELGEYDKAITYADKMASIRPDLRSYSRISYLREIHGHVKEAIEAMKMAVAAGYPGMEQTEWARLTLGHLYERYGSRDSAMMQYEMALSERPNYPFAIASLAKSFALSGNMLKADSLNEVARQLIPEVSFYIDRANWEQERGNQVLDASLTKEILTMMADDEKAGHKMGLELSKVYLRHKGDTEGALKYALDEYMTRPGNIDVNRMLAEIYVAKGDLTKAKEHLVLALRTGSKDPETKCLEGMIMAKTDRMAEGTALIKSVFVEIPYLDCSFCREARSIVL